MILKESFVFFMDTEKPARNWWRYLRRCNTRATQTSSASRHTVLMMCWTIWNWPILKWMGPSIEHLFEIIKVRVKSEQFSLTRIILNFQSVWRHRSELGFVPVKGILPYIHWRWTLITILIAYLKSMKLESGFSLCKKYQTGNNKNFMLLLCFLLKFHTFYTTKNTEKALNLVV
jgi:hypothetical protein